MSLANALRLLLVVVGGVLILLLLAGWHPGMPWSPATTLSPEITRWQGQGVITRVANGELAVSGSNPDGSSLVAQSLPAFEAGGYRYLQLETDGLVGDRLVFLLLQSNGENRRIQLPGHPDGWLVTDLAQQAGWRGPVQALGLLILPTNYLSGHLAETPDYRLLTLRFESPNLRAALAALFDRWFGYRPWNGRSNHTGGYEHGAPSGPPLQGFVAALLGWVLLVLWLTRHPARMRVATRAALLGGLFLAVHQIGQLALRSEVAMRSARIAADHPDWPLGAMPAMQREADRLLDNWRVAPPPRVLVWGQQGFFREYPTWLLRERNVASLVLPSQLALLPHPEPGTVLVLGGKEGWTYDPARGELQLGETRIAAQPRQQGSLLHVFAIGAGASP